jgi:VCBS repeat-containing protein
MLAAKAEQAPIMRQAANPEKRRLVASLGHARTGDDFAVSAIAILANFIGAAWLVRADANPDDAPLFDTLSVSASGSTVAHANAGDTPAAGRPSSDGASAADALFAPLFEAAHDGAASPPAADGSNHDWTDVFTSDGSFRFDPDQDAVTDPAAHVGNTNSAAEGFSTRPDASMHDMPSMAEGSFAAAASGLSHSGAPGGDPMAGVTGANGVPAIGAAAALPAGPASQQSQTPVLAWLGDIGSGATNGASSANGGTAVNNANGGSGLVIDVVYDASVANAPAGFTAAVAAVVAYYESHFSNPVTITIDVGYGEIDGQALAPDALGESETYLTSVSYAALHAALVKNADAIGDSAAAASLPATSPVSGQYWVSTAEARALGLAGADTSVDGYAGFSNAVSFDYNDANGIGANQYDFFGVVAHEFSEVMGRQMMDGEHFSGAAGYEPLDLFHYSAPGVRDFSGTTAGYASPDGGATNLDNFNTNPDGDFGDWAASAGDNSYLAFSSPGVADPVTASDFTVMNLLGWDPGSSTTPPPVVVAAHAHDTLGGSVAKTAASGVLVKDLESDSGAVLSVSAVDGSRANVSHAVAGAYGTLTLHSNGSYTYTNTNPDAVNHVKEDTFDYTVSNGDGGTANSSLTILITNPSETYVTGAQGGTIRGASGPTVLDGSAGDMNLTAGTGGHQWLVGGPGDTLAGNTARDTFMFAPGFGDERVDHFNSAHDVIDLPKSLFPDFAAVKADMEASRGNTVITLDGGDAITLMHVAPSQLHAHNFHFII